MRASSARAAGRASGVAPTRGGNNFATIQGKTAINVSDGTDAARNQLPNPISRPAFCTICTPIGLVEEAVIHSAEEIARPAMAQNIKEAPSRLPSTSSGLDPVFATYRTIGKRTPPRAVLLWKAGAMTASVSTML